MLRKTPEEIRPGVRYLASPRQNRALAVRTGMDGDITGFRMGQVVELNAERDVPRLFILTQGVFSHTSFDV